MKRVNRMLSVFTLMAVAGSVMLSAATMESHTSAKFQGPKANTGTVTHSIENGYVKDIAKVQVYCAYAEVLLGEAPFSMPAK